jgi:hypothetical protein
MEGKKETRRAEWGLSAVAGRGCTAIRLFNSMPLDDGRMTETCNNIGGGGEELLRSRTNC